MSNDELIYQPEEYEELENIEGDMLLDPTIQLLRKDLIKIAPGLDVAQVRHLVKTYYQIQDFRKASHLQAISLAKRDMPNLCISWASAAMGRVETDIKLLMDHYTRREPTGMGEWLRAITGIGPVLAAGLMAHIRIEQAPTVGHIWRYAGLDPTSVWLGTEKAKTLVNDVIRARIEVEGMPTLRGNRRPPITAEDLAELSAKSGRNVERLLEAAREDDESDELSRAKVERYLARRPWNSDFKTLCWKIGESFVKVSGHRKDLYGKLYLKRKAYEIAKNDKMEYTLQAREVLENKHIDPDTVAYGFYSVGKLPPGHIHSRAKRYAVKQFLSDVHAEMYWRHFGKSPPLPYPIAILGHSGLRNAEAFDREHDGERSLL